jgi:hypothetical protein
MPRILISELSSTIDESCVIKLNYGYSVDSAVHHLNNPFALNKEVGLPPQTCCDVDTSLTSIKSSSISSLGTVSEEVLHLERGVYRKFNRDVERIILDRRRQPTNG